MADGQRASAPTVRYVNAIHTIDDLGALLKDDAAVAHYRERFIDRDCLIVKNAVDRDQLEAIKVHLTRVGQNSMPCYRKIEEGCPNFHRVVDCDQRSDVVGRFHQFAYFPWNQDVFDVFELFRKVYHLKNRLSGLPEERYLGMKPEQECTARVAFQFYPSGGGMMHRHSDPVGYHQLVVPTVVMSKRGDDYKEGGLFLEREDGTRVEVEDMVDVGDSVFFHAEVVHGVAPVDPGEPRDWLSFRGRWMGLIAVNRLHANEQVARSLDLDRT